MKPTYEQLEQQLAAVVAENAGLKMYRPQPGGAAMMEALDAFEAQDDYPEGGMMDAFEILCCKRVRTPATDAYLNGIRDQAKADGVQEYADSFRHTAAKVRELYGESIRYRSLMHEGSTAEAFAAQLRQGAKS